MSLFLGIEIGGTKLQLALGRGDGRIVDLVRETVDPARGAEGIRRQIAEAALAWKGRFLGVGIGFGGPFDEQRGIALKSHQIAGWDEFPLVQWVRDSLGIASVTVQNDADTAALGEARFGAGVGRSPLLYVTIGSGIGGGLIVDGRIYRGASLGAVELGHLWVDLDGESRILENWASGWAIGRAGSELQGSAISGAKVAEMAVAGDSRARAILDRSTKALGHALAHAVTLMAPRRIVLGGGVSLMSDDFWLEPIRKTLHDRVFPPFRGQYDVVTAKLGEEVVLHGALALARDAALADGSFVQR